MQPALDDVGGASFPQVALAILADLRRYPDVEVILDGERAWVRWPAGTEVVLRRVLTLPAVELYVRREHGWCRLGNHLPAFGTLLDRQGQPLCQVLFPSPVRVPPPPNVQRRPERLHLVPDDRPRETSGLLCDLTDLMAWVETATTAQLGAIQAARLDTLVMLLGINLPLLPRGERFWGHRLLAPLGYRPEPALPDSAVWKALNLDDNDLLVLRTCGAEVMPKRVLQPLTRAGARLAQHQ